ncbi:uncharacterized protein LOC125039297 [Penaeus chinensis]|uniref:uncharacterized protein LOC125039297 n=1 Tax=Penaeus chinensis TaxID=139456 RepID=UPI001FB72CBD|nr:uncharacterized protein LOC125039297 [Penaeus chinensis]
MTLCHHFSFFNFTDSYHALKSRHLEGSTVIPSNKKTTTPVSPSPSPGPDVQAISGAKELLLTLDFYLSIFLSIPNTKMSDDAELAAIREKRMQELQGMQDSPFGLKVPGNAPAMQGQHQKQEEMMQQQQQAINGLLNQVLDQQARARRKCRLVYF